MSRKHDEEMSCREFVEIVTEYLEGALSEERRAALHAHIDECGGCSAYLAQMEQTIAALRGLDGERDLPGGAERRSRSVPRAPGRRYLIFSVETIPAWSES